MKRLLIITVIAAVGTSLFAQATPSCDPDKQDCSVKDTMNFLRSAGVQSRVEKQVVNANRATTTPSAFAAHIHNSYEDFLNLLSFAINKVDESSNGQALIVRFNPVREGENLFGASLTAAEPTVADVVKNAIPEAARDATVLSLQKKLSDTNDLTWAAAYSIATAHCDASRPGTQRCWGRSPQAYRDLLATVLLELIKPSEDLGDALGLIVPLFPTEAIRGAGGKLDKLLLSQAGDKRSQVLARLRQAVAAERASVQGANSVYEAHHLDMLAKLIDNQPQASLNASYHKLGALGGPSERAVSVELHFGNQNVNAIRAACSKNEIKQLGACLQQQIDELATSTQSPTKYVLTGTYKKVATYRLASLPIETPMGFQPIDLPGAAEYHVQGQLGRDMATQVNGKSIRADGSVEFIRSERGAVRTQNRLVGVLTFSVPFGDTLTVPVSVTYANKPEFLGDGNRRISAHVGLSYRLPDLFGKN